MEEKKAETPNKKKKSKARIIVESVVLGVFGLFALAALAGMIDQRVHAEENYSQPIRFGLGAFTVESGSMEPDYLTGSAIITYKKDLALVREAHLAGETVDVTFADDYNEENELTVPKDTRYNDRTTRPGKVLIITHRVFDIKVDETKEYGKGRYLIFVAGINTAGKYSREHQYQVFTEKQYLGTVIGSSQFLGGTLKFFSSPEGIVLLVLIPCGIVLISSAFDIVRAIMADKKEGNKQ